KDAKRSIAFHFSPSAKRTIRSETAKVMKTQLQVNETERQREPLVVEEATYRVASVARDGRAVVELTIGADAATLEITPQGRMKITSPHAPPQLAAAINQVPAALPTGPIGEGARWHIFQKVDLFGTPADAVTVVTVTRME